MLREFFKQEDPLPAARDMYSPAVVQINATSANSGANRNQKSEFDGQQRHEEQSTHQQVRKCFFLQRILPQEERYVLQVFVMYTYCTLSTKFNYDDADWPS